LKIITKNKKIYMKIHKGGTGERKKKGERKEIYIEKSKREKRENHHREGKGASRYAFFYKIIFALILCVIHFKIGLYTYCIKFFRTCITPCISLPSQKNINIVLPHASYTHLINPSIINLSLITMQSSTFHFKPLRQPCKPRRYHVSHLHHQQHTPLHQRSH